jgi:hypothetical protein
VRFTPVDPRVMDSAVSWADATALTLYNIATVPRLTREDDWRGWAMELIGDPSIASFGPPSPDALDDWREWAFLFNEALLSRSAA